jgi:methylmalonyl-CoA mutase N-terminal domain/subunit
VADTVDPFAGSYAVEHLTNELERHASQYIEKIDALGGMLRAIELGYVQREIQEAAYTYQRAVETGDATVVGVNRFQIEEESAPSLLRVDPAIEGAQVERLRALRARRDAYAVEAALAALEAAARTTTENLLPLMLTAVEAYATVGEISHRLRRVWGEYREAVTV